jgi:hypothetical protein
MKMQSVPRREHCAYYKKANRRAMYMEKWMFITKHINTMCGHDAENLALNLTIYKVTTNFGVKYSYH